VGTSPEINIERQKEAITMARNIFIALVALILCFIFFEGVLRLSPFLYSDGYRPSSKDELVYELEPGFLIRSVAAKISPQGMNDRYFSVTKPPHVYRIAIIGDSMSFGWKVKLEHSFPKVLEGFLNRDGMQCEVLNFSVPGYNTAQEMELIKEKVLRFAPDAVILFYCGNDVNMCNYFKPSVSLWNYLYVKSYAAHFILRKIDEFFYLMSKRSRLIKTKLLPFWRWVKNHALGMFYEEKIICKRPGLEETDLFLNEHPGIGETMRDNGVMPTVMDPPLAKGDVPQRYWYMLGYDNYKKHISYIQTILGERDIRFISCGFFDDSALTINKGLGIFVCDFNDYLREKGISYEKIKISPNDWHMNMLGHYLCARYIYQKCFLRRN